MAGEDESKRAETPTPPDEVDLSGLRFRISDSGHRRAGLTASGILWLEAVTDIRAAPSDGFSTPCRALVARGVFRTIGGGYSDSLVRLVEFGTVRAEGTPVVLSQWEPPSSRSAEASAIGLDRDSVLLLVGDGHEVTTRFASALAAATDCRVELAGRSSPAAAEDAGIAVSRTRAELRAAVAAAGVRSLGEIERAVDTILGRREIAAIIAKLGDRARYRTVATHPAAIRHLVQEVHAEHGRLDGVICAVDATDVAHAVLAALAELPTVRGFAAGPD